MAAKMEPREVRTVRIGAAEWQMVEGAALLEGVPPSTWLRDVALRVAREKLGREIERHA